MPGKRDCACAGLSVRAIPKGERGLYFTDEILKVDFHLQNTTNKRLRGELTVFYGYGPSGSECRSPENIQFDIVPQGTQDIPALERLVGIQGNGIIGMCLPASGIERDAILSENGIERVLKASNLTSNIHTLYTFTSMEREFYKQCYERPVRLTWAVVILTFFVCVLTIVLIAIEVN